jgi:ketosteroid isomerase-like protein|tara:strand:- start:275 stop:748 length:474 start_codon:yes stop_codon:yes gene_type:complete
LEKLFNKNKMKKLNLIGFSLLLFSCQTNKVEIPYDKSETISIIKTNLEAQELAWNTGDLSTFMEHYWKSDSMAFMGKTGVTYGWQQTLDAYKAGYPTQKEMGILEFEIKKLDVLSSDAAYMLGSWNIERDTLDVGGHFSLILKKIAGHWVIVTDHTS